MLVLTEMSGRRHHGLLSASALPAHAGSSDVPSYDRSSRLHAAARASKHRRDYFFHDFVASRINPLHTAVGPHPCNRILGHVAVSAVQLHAFVNDAALAIR